MIPWNSPINLRGNLGDVDGSPAGMGGGKCVCPQVTRQGEEFLRLTVTEMNELKGKKIKKIPHLSIFINKQNHKVGLILQNHHKFTGLIWSEPRSKSLSLLA